MVAPNVSVYLGQSFDRNRQALAGFHPSTKRVKASGNFRNRSRISVTKYEKGVESSSVYGEA